MSGVCYGKLLISCYFICIYWFAVPYSLCVSSFHEICTRLLFISQGHRFIYALPL